MAGRYTTGGLDPDRYQVFRKLSPETVPNHSRLHRPDPPDGQLYELVQGFRFPLNPYDDPHARRAMLRYAASVHDENQDLAHDLLALLRGIEDGLPEDERVCSLEAVCSLTGHKLN